MSWEDTVKEDEAERFARIRKLERARLRYYKARDAYHVELEKLKEGSLYKEMVDAYIALQRLGGKGLWGKGDD